MKSSQKIFDRVAIVSFLILIAFLINPKSSQACTTVQATPGTVPANTTEALVKKSDLILEGTVLATTPNFGGGENYAYVKVERYFKAENGLNPVKPGVYLHFICGNGISIKSGQRGIFFAVSANSTSDSIEPVSFIGEEDLTPEVTAKVIEAVGRNPLMPQADMAVPDLIATFKSDGLNTPGVPFIQTNTVISFVANSFFASKTSSGFPIIILFLGICIVHVLIVVVAWLGSKRANGDKSKESE